MLKDQCRVLVQVLEVDVRPTEIYILLLILLLIPLADDDRRNDRDRDRERDRDRDRERDRGDDGQEDRNRDPSQLPAFDEFDPEVGTSGEYLHELVSAFHLLRVAEKVAQAHVFRGADSSGA